MKRPGRRIVVWVTLVCAIVGGAAGWMVGATRSTGYVSTATILINPLPGNPFWERSPTDLVSMQTEAQQVRSDAVLSAVAESTDGPVDAPADVSVLRRRVSVYPATGSEVIRLSYRAQSPQVSEALVQALAAATLDRRAKRASAANAQQFKAVERTINQVKQELRDTHSRAAKRVLTQRMIVLRVQSRALEAARLDPGLLITLTTEKSSKKAFRVGLAVLGAAAGALAGRWLARRVVRRRFSAATNP